MRTTIVWGCLLAILIEPCMSDMYMHFPPGSNNRLNGNQDNVRNANRLFDSQVRRNFNHTSSYLFQAGQELACALTQDVITSPLMIIHYPESCE